MTTDETAIRRTRIYDDPLFNYAQFWTGRDKAAARSREYRISHSPLSQVARFPG